jgi:hypothetical protein
MTANPKCSSPIKPLAIGAASIDDTSVATGDRAAARSIIWEDQNL